ncbi:MAG: DUF3109 family protein [Bacteroidales bacterium]|nr:DUF3109 family protein [Bacteroidales bacterium]
MLTEYFCCHPALCKGFCCVEGDSGAPLTPEECVLLDAEWPRFAHYMQPSGIETIKRQGAWVIDVEEDAVTPLIDKGECAYAYFNDSGTCMCAIEKHWTVHQAPLRKPNSCWLYPIRVQKLSNGSIGLNYHRWHLCQPARELGTEKKMRVFEFCKEPLIHCFGEKVYRAITMAADNSL